MAETFWNWFNPLKWHWKALVLLFFWWVIIPLYAWTKSDWPSPIKWTVTVICTALFLSVAAAQTSPPPANEITAPAPPEAAEPQAPPKKPVPEITYKTLEVTESVSFAEERIQDSNLEKGQSQVRQEGANGIKTFVYKVQLKDGVEVTRTLEKEFVFMSPAPKIIAEGTKEPPPPPPPPPAPTPLPAQPAAPSRGQTVYGTNTGARYHQDHGHVGGCHSYLRSSKIPMTISEAQARGLTPCQCGSCRW